MSTQDTAPVAPIVALTDGVPTTTTLAIAEGAKTEHASVIKLVRTYLADLEEFGRVAFETRSQAKSNSGFEIANSDKGSDLKSNPSGAGRPTEYARLNEQQTTLLFTYMKNTPIVRGFKRRLVREFYDMARSLRETAPVSLPSPVLSRILLTLDGGRVVKSEPVPDDAQVCSIAYFRELAALRGFRLISPRNWLDVCEVLGMVGDEHMPALARYATGRMANP
ncbi:Phage regulatory protein Rha (Phage_pRha) [Methylomagnum ishizawai]|uniref:Phage regulatory protein Rha (Phage_pRha) n=1 Tax=Methylomagnum ishizawai TaxID=1760988 RepID=A0A1Y6D0B6_9GAMM|nr:Rha family transcriptional regulator [Methylomagnum ishizawai]SMF96077.1 Phage regulatory protein Rha (Phage_pRha) [Methylomagnum ishizawai]